MREGGAHVHYRQRPQTRELGRRCRPHHTVVLLRRAGGRSGQSCRSTHVDGGSRAVPEPDLLRGHHSGGNPRRPGIAANRQDRPACLACRNRNRLLVRAVCGNHDDAADQRGPADLQRSAVDARDRLVGVSSESIDGDVGRCRDRICGCDPRASASTPSLQHRDPLALAGALLLAVALMSVRWLGATEPMPRILFYYFLFSTVMVLPFALVEW